MGYLCAHSFLKTLALLWIFQYWGKKPPVTCLRALFRFAPISPYLPLHPISDADSPPHTHLHLSICPPSVPISCTVVTYSMESVVVNSSNASKQDPICARVQSAQPQNPISRLGPNMTLGHIKEGRVPLSIDISSHDWLQHNSVQQWHS